MRLGIVTDTQLAKARVGEFMYGLDAANQSIYAADTPTAFAYYKLMGVDLLRAPPMYGPYTDEKIEKSFALLKEHNLRALLFTDPGQPEGENSPLDQEHLARVADMVTRYIKKYGGREVGQMPLVELGNEPDLPKFWRGSIDQYIEAMNVLADAARRAREQAGLKPEDVIIMNGGLSFAGQTGDRRSREFLKKADLTKLDAISYHGHGPGIEAERNAFERLMGALKEAGKPPMMAFETESGFSANSEAGLMEQARTVVEKMTYAQSVGSPGFLFFRLFMESPGTNEGGYGLTDNVIEPRPSVLAYRNMVERLRHHRFVKALDTTQVLNTDGVIAFVFEEINEEQQPTGGKAIVALSEKPASYELAVRTGTLKNLAMYDLFGNQLNTPPLGGDMALLPVALDSVYLTWDSPLPAAEVTLVPSLLGVEIAETPLVGQSGRVKIIVRNPTDQPMEANVQLVAAGDLKLAVRPKILTARLRPNGQAELAATLEVADSDMPLYLPKNWTVFPDADPNQIEAVLKSGKIPETLAQRGGGTVNARHMWAPDGRINMLPWAGGSSFEHRPALGFAYVDSPRDATLPAAASADWWMTWYANEKQVYTTQPQGNNHGTLADHRFDLPLKQGRNLIAFHLGSGSHGFAIHFGGPRERALAVPGGQPLERLEAVLKVHDEHRARLVIPITVEPPLVRLASLPTSDAEWAHIEPLAVLDADTVENFFFKEPDSRRWYKGQADLSAHVWFAEGPDKHVHLYLKVADDQHTPGDGVEFVLANDDGAVLERGQLTGKRSGEHTTYSAKLPVTKWGPKPARFNLVVRDDDGFGLQQLTRIGDIETPAAGMRLTLGMQ